MKIYHPPLTPPIKGGEVLARAGNEGVGTNPSNQGREMGLVFYQGRKSPNSLWKRVREVTVAAGKSFVLSPLPLREGKCLPGQATKV
jgi:hypothetical protein